MFNRISRRIAAVAIILMVLTTARPTEVLADVSYDTYSYDYWGEAVLQPHVYLYERTIAPAGAEYSLSEPRDMAVTKDGLFIADTGNSRILKLDFSGAVVMEINSADGEEDVLNKPQGVFVADDGHIYVADSGNGRVIEYDENGVCIRKIGRPETELVAASTAYVPTRVVVDTSGNMYVIAYGINMGLVEFDKNGVFQGFMGATEVSVSTFDYIWKNYFSTEEQQQRMETIIPTEYSNIFLDNEDFIYATISNLTEKDIAGGADMVRRLNPTGTDILRRLGNNDITGDIFTTEEGHSTFVDVCANSYGCYFILDSTDGKVFAYDYDGNSLFVFGDMGAREGCLQNPASIGISPDDETIYILDTQLGMVMTYDITDYGRNLLGALKSNRSGNSEEAFRCWGEVLKQNANNELAYIGLGKTYLKEGDYSLAMDYFQLGNSKKYYSEAFYFYRKELMQENFGTMMAIVGAVLGVFIIIKCVKKFRRWVGEVKCIMRDR